MIKALPFALSYPHLVVIYSFCTKYKNKIDSIYIVLIFRILFWIRFWVTSTKHCRIRIKVLTHTDTELCTLASWERNNNITLYDYIGPLQKLSGLSHIIKYDGLTFHRFSI